MLTLFIKKTLVVLFFITIANNLYSQNPFLGTWKYQNGNEVFYVTLFNDGAETKGDYKKVIINNNNTIVSEVYRSNKPFHGTIFPTCIGLKYNAISQSLQGIISDNSIDYSNYNPGRTHKKGKLIIRLLESCLGCPPTASWKVEVGEGIRIMGDPDFNIPTDIIITKVE